MIRSVLSTVALAVLIASVSQETFVDALAQNFLALDIDSSAADLGSNSSSEHAGIKHPHNHRIYHDDDADEDVEISDSKGVRMMHQQQQKKVEDETDPWHHPFIQPQQYGLRQAPTNDLYYPSLSVSEIEIAGYRVIYASDPPGLLDDREFPDLQQVYFLQHGGWWTDLEILPSWGSTEPTSRVGYVGLIFMTEALCTDGKDPEGDPRCLRKAFNDLPDGPCRKYLPKFKHCDRYHMWSTISPGPRHLWSAGGISRTKDGYGVSSFTVMDVALGHLRRKNNFPNLKRLEMVAQCSGATFLYLYSLINQHFGKMREQMHLRLMLTNPSSFSWYGEDRPFQKQCSNVTAWPYGSNLEGMMHLRHRDLRSYPQVPTYIVTGTRDIFFKEDEPCARIAQGASRAERARFFAKHLLNTSGDEALNRVTFIEEEASHDYMHMLMERRPFVSLLRDASDGQKWDTFPDYGCSEPSKVLNASVPVTGWDECQRICSMNSSCKVATLWEGKSCSTYEYCTHALARTKLLSFKRKTVNLDLTCTASCKKHEKDGCVSFYVNVDPDAGTAECELLQKRAGRHELAIRPGFDEVFVATRRRRRTINSDFRKMRNVPSEAW